MKIEERKRGGGVVGGQTNKQTTHRFPAALSTIPGETPSPLPPAYTHLHLR